MKEAWFNPNTSFIKLPIIWWTVLILIAVSFLVGLIIKFHSSHYLCGSASCFNFFLAEYKMPLGILALIIPIVALYAAAHRSAQTTEQIRITNSQNLFSNYYKHIEEFEKYIEIMVIGDLVRVFDIRRLHRALYPNAKSGDYSTDQNIAALVFSEVRNVIQMIERLGDKELTKESLVAISYRFKLIESQLSGVTFERDYTKDGINGGVGLRNFFHLLVDRILVIHTVLSFDLGLEFSPDFDLVESYTVDKLPDLTIKEILGQKIDIDGLLTVPIRSLGEL